jgi:hypothetical protein
VNPSEDPQTLFYNMKLADSVVKKIGPRISSNPEYCSTRTVTRPEYKLLVEEDYTKLKSYGAYQEALDDKKTGMGLEPIESNKYNARRIYNIECLEPIVLI